MEETERLDIRIPKQLKRELAVRASLDRRTRTDVVIIALEQYMENAALAYRKVEK